MPPRTSPSHRTPPPAETAGQGPAEEAALSKRATLEDELAALCDGIPSRGQADAQPLRTKKFQEWLATFAGRHGARAYLFLKEYLLGKDKDRMTPRERASLRATWASILYHAGRYARFQDEWENGSQKEIAGLRRAAAEPGAADADKLLIPNLTALSVNCAMMLADLGDVPGALEACRAAFELAAGLGKNLAAGQAAAHETFIAARAAFAAHGTQGAPGAFAALTEARRRLASVTDDQALEALRAVPARHNLCATVLAARLEAEIVSGELMSESSLERRSQDVRQLTVDQDTLSRLDYLEALFWASRSAQFPWDPRLTRPLPRDGAAQRAQEILWSRLSRGDRGAPGLTRPFAQIAELQNQLLLAPHAALLARIAPSDKLRRESSLRAWAAVRRQLRGVRGVGGEWKSPSAGTALDGLSAQEALRGAQAAFPELGTMEPARQAVHLDAHADKMEHDDLRALSTELQRRTDTKSAHKFVELLRKHCGVECLLVVPLAKSAEGAREPAPRHWLGAKCFGFSPAVARYAHESGKNAQPTERRKRTYESNRLRNEESQARIRAAGAQEKFEYDPIVLRQILDKCRPGSWAGVKREIKFGEYASGSMSGAIFECRDADFLIVIDRGDRVLGQLDPARLEEVRLFVDNYLRAAGDEYHRAILETQNRDLLDIHKNCRDLISAILAFNGGGYGDRASHEIGNGMTAQAMPLEGIPVTQEEMRSATGRYKEVIDDLLALARKRQDAAAGKTVQLDRSTAAAQVFNRVEERLNTAGHERSRTLAMRGMRLARSFGNGLTPGTSVAVDDEILDALTRLVADVARLAPDRCEITLRFEACERPGFFRLTVSSPSQHPFDAEHFVPFKKYRGMQHVNHSSAAHRYDVAGNVGEVGAALPLVALAVRERGGDVTIPPQEPGRATVTVELPLSK